MTDQTRRSFLRQSSAAMGLLAAPSLVGCAVGTQPGTSSGTGLRAKTTSDPFSLGVASGGSRSGGFVLWTRLAPDPLSDDMSAPGGMRGGPVPVAYEIAADPGMRSIVRKGIATAEPQFAYSVHEEVMGLVPGQFYWYRFLLGNASSRVGRAMTMPSPNDDPDRLRLGIVSCSNYEHGYFSAYRHLAKETPDLVLFLGDYIYEGIETKNPVVRRHHNGLEAKTLAGYRSRYEQYRLDPDLQRLHADVTALMTWDDHEVQNDYAGGLPSSADDPQAFLKRRAAAYQAYYEHMPLRPLFMKPGNGEMRIYDRFAFGKLAEISMIDGRQYRSAPACSSKGSRAHVVFDDLCAERLDARRSMLGAAQEDWLFDGLAKSQAQWNIIGQDVLMAQNRERMPDGKIGFWSDDWNGYPASRDRLIRHMHDSEVSNPVVLGGDLHSFWSNDLKLDFNDAKSPTVASEFVGTSISSNPPPYEAFVKFLADNPHIHYFESRHRGYISAEIERGRMTTKFRTVADVRNPQTNVSTLKTYVVENGRAGAIEA